MSKEFSDLGELDKVLRELQEFSAEFTPKTDSKLEEQNSFQNENEINSIDNGSITSSQESLVARMQRQKELRIRDEEIHEQEKKRLDEIMNMFDVQNKQDAINIEIKPKIENNHNEQQINQINVLNNTYTTDDFDYDEINGYDNYQVNYRDNNGNAMTSYSTFRSNIDHGNSNTSDFKSNKTTPTQTFMTNAHNGSLYSADSLSGSSHSTSCSADSQEKLKNQRKIIVNNMLQIKQKVASIDCQQSESFNEFEVERSLLEGERNSEFQILKQFTSRYESIEEERTKKLKINLQDCEEVSFQLENERIEIERVNDKIQDIRNQISNCSDDHFKKLLNEEESNLHNSYEMHEKLFEDNEFRLFELQTHADEQRERLEMEIEKEKNDLIRLVDVQKNKINRIDGELNRLINMCKKDVENFEKKRNEHILEFKRFSKSLLECDTQMESFSDSSAGGGANNNNINNNNGNDFPSEPPASGWTHMSDAFSQLKKAIDERSIKQLQLENVSKLSDEVKFRKSNGMKHFERPLTRYFPVLDDSRFNLKSHLESCGHHLKEIVDVLVTDTSCQGWLQKLSGSKPRRWQKRWFVLDRNRRHLAYFSSKLRNEKMSPRDSISFDDIIEVYVQPSGNGTFCVQTRNKTLTLQSCNSQSRAVWIDAIFVGGAHGYNQFVDRD